MAEVKEESLPTETLPTGKEAEEVPKITNLDPLPSKAKGKANPYGTVKTRKTKVGTTSTRSFNKTQSTRVKPKGLVTSRGPNKKESKRRVIEPLPEDVCF